MKNTSMKKRLTWVFGIIDFFILSIIGASLYMVYSLDNVPQDRLTRFTVYMILTAVVTVIIMTFFTTTILHSLRVSVAELKRVSDEVAIGNVDVEIKKYGNDEFGYLSDEYQVLINNIKEQAEVIEEVAQGNLTVNVRVKSESDLMGNSLKKLVNDTHYALSNIHDAADQVLVSSSEVAGASEALAQGSTEQASAIEEITASIDEIAEKTKVNAQEADSAAELMEQAINSVKEGNQKMKEMITAMNDINVSSENISKIIKVIDDIAFQTNILALNAAVEAARAGDAGMGFAVVAEEVRNLAAKSASAAAETAEMIEDSIRKVHNGSEIADATSEELEAISKIVSESESIVRGIAEASNYQATSIEQIDQAIGQVSQVVQSNSSTSEECAAASIELSNQASRMQELIAVYKLGSDSQSSYAMKQPKKSMNAIRKENKNESIISLNDGFGKY